MKEDFDVFRVPNISQGIALDNAGDGLTFRKELIYVNEPDEFFIKKTEDNEQTFQIGQKHLEHWEKTGNQMLKNGLKIPTPIKHSDEPERNRGQIKRFEIDYNDSGRLALFGIVKFRDAEAAKLAASTDVSIFVPNKPVIDGLGRKYEMPIRHVCFTDYPVIPGLGEFESIAASFELSRIPFVDRVRDEVRKSKAWSDSYMKEKYPDGKGGILRPNIKKDVHDTVKKGVHAAKRFFGDVKKSFGESVRDDVQPVKNVVHKLKSAVRTRTDDALKATTRRVAEHTRDAIKEVVHEEFHKAKAHILGAPRRFLKSLPHKRLGLGVAAGAAGASYLIRQHLSKNPKEVAASLELSRTQKRKPRPPKAIVPPVKKPRGIAATRAVASSAKNAPIRAAAARKFGKHISIATAALIGAGVLHELHHHAFGDHSDELSNSLTLDYQGKDGKMRKEDGTFAKNPNSKTALRNKARGERRAFGSARASTSGETGLPSYKASIQHVLHNINDYYHADKNELNSGSNFLRAGKHVGVGSLHAGVAALGGAGVYKYGKAFGKHALHSAGGIASKGSHRNLIATIAALGAAGLGAEGMSAHFHAAGQHIRAALRPRKK